MIIIISFTLFFIAMIIFMLYLLYLAVYQNNLDLLYFGLGIPIFFYFLILALKQYSKIKIENDSFTIRYLFFSNKTIYYNQIDLWEDTFDIRTPQKVLIFHVNGKKISISSLSDSDNFEKLRFILDIRFAEKGKYKQKNKSPNR